MTCEMAKEFLSRHGVAYELKVLDEPATIAEFKERYGFLTGPLTVVGGEGVLGYNVPALTAALRKAGLYEAAGGRSRGAGAAAPRGLGVAAAGAVVVTNFLDDSLT